jgi:hypothetical protein
MESNLEMPYDTSFAYAYIWSSPEQDLKKALEILKCPLLDHQSAASCPARSDDYHEVKTLLASNPDTPTQVLDHLSEYNSHPQILERLAGNPQTSGATLRRLSQSIANEVRAAVADNTNADDDTIRALAKDEHIDVRFRLAENPNLSTEILEQLAHDDNPYVAYRAQMTLTRVTNQNATVLNVPPRSNQSASDQRKAM